MLLPSYVEINDRFKKALELMEETSHNLFITGKAGVGKSTLLALYCQRSRQSRPVILAPTGVAALNVRGQTIHSFFDFSVDVTKEKILQHKFRPRRQKLFSELKSIIIDEVSMLRADLLDCIDASLRMYGPTPHTAFGGVQMIFIGDLFQLPPVVMPKERDTMSEHYSSPYFFSAYSFQESEFHIIELEKVYRQKDRDFVELLNRVRSNTVSDADLAKINSRLVPHFSPMEKSLFVRLTTTNKRAEQANMHHLSLLKGEALSSRCVVEGDFGIQYYPTFPELFYKKGAQIMLLNNDSKRRWVNGSIGVIAGVLCRDGEEILQVRLGGCSDLVEVTRYTWNIYRFFSEKGQIKSQSVGTFSQLPFRLAWAVTIHKSQGKTFDQVAIDMEGGAFASGQAYVGLSRCTSLEGIILLKKITRVDIRTDARISKYFTANKYH